MSLSRTQPGVSRTKWNVLRRRCRQILGAGVLCLACSSLVWAANKPDTWQEIKSDHFIVFYRHAPDYFVKSVLKDSEAIYRRTTYSLGFTRVQGWIGSKQVRIYVYDTAEEYHRATTLKWSGGSVSILQRTIRTFPAANGFFDSTLPHELGHIIFRDFVGMRADIPLWLEEGIAVYQEKAGRLNADYQVRKAIAAGKFIPLSALGQSRVERSFPKGRIKLAYAESASVVAYLLERGETYRFVRLCRELKDGRRFEWALPKAYMQFRTVSDLEKAWKDTLGNGSDR